MANVNKEFDTTKCIEVDLADLVVAGIHHCLRPKCVPKVSQYRIIPCGQCPECLRRKGNEMFVRCMEQLKDYGFMRVFTLTYRPQDLPVFETEFIIHEPEFECNHKYLEFKSQSLKDSSEFLERAPYNWVSVRKNDGSMIRCRKYSPFTQVLGNIMYVQYQSVYRSHVQTWLRDNRIRYKRSHDGKDSDLKYVIVQEYGSNTFNPHYHCLLFCSDKSLLDSLRDSWKYGFCYEDTASENDPEHVSKIAKYCTKYISKGKFDCPYIKRGYCQKPHIMISSGFGCSKEWQRLKDLILCKDVYGVINQEDFSGASADDYSGLVDDLRARRLININGFYYGLPRYYRHKIFFRKEYDPELDREMVRASPLSQMVTDSVLCDLNRECHNDEVRMQRYAESIGQSFFEVQQSLLAARERQARTHEKSYLNVMKTTTKF